MKFDTVIMGGGLTGLVAGIALQKAGKRTCMVTQGQSALHFWSGSFGFMREPGMKLPDLHPYNVIGMEETKKLLSQVPAIFAEAGLQLHGSLDANHLHITPIGYFEPAWLTIDDYYRFPADGATDFKKVAIVNVSGFIDFYPLFLARGFEGIGVETVLKEVDTDAIEFVRRSCTEMRATNMARVFTPDAIRKVAEEVERVSEGTDAVFMPAIFGMFDDESMKLFRSEVSRPVWFVPTIPASVPGTRCQLSLKALYVKLGGKLLAGDVMEHSEVENGKLKKVFTRNLEEMPLEGDTYVLATGSFFGHGLIASLERIREPIIDCDLNLSRDRDTWYNKDYFAPQPYMEAGVETDDKFRPKLKGQVLENVYAAGSILPGFNALKEGTGAGSCLASALFAVKNILNR